MRVRAIAEDTVAEAIGRSHRDDPVVGVGGGPAGNAALTAWIGLILLVLFLVELATLINVRSLISWHVFVGVLLIPPALAKTATTGWRIVRYYTGQRQYRAAGPPPLILRMLGPLVVATTLGLLGSGLALILINPASARDSVVGPVSLLMIHKGMFVLWAGVTGLHTLGRLIPAMRLTVQGRGRVPGRAARITLVVATVTVAVAAAAIALPGARPWQTERPFHAHSREHHFGNR